MAQQTINNGESGSIVRAKLNANFGELYARATVGSASLGTTSPWISTTSGPELWLLANFRSGFGWNQSTLTPSLTANSSAQNMRTNLFLGNLANQDRAFRFRFTVASMPNDGWATVQVTLTDAGGGPLAGTESQLIVTNSSNVRTGEFVFDFLPKFTGDVYFDVRIDVFNNASSGTLSLTNCSVKEITHVTRPLMYGEGDSNGGPIILQQLFNPRTGNYQAAFTEIGADGQLSQALKGINVYDSEFPLARPPADPLFQRATVSVADPVSGTLQVGTYRSMRIGNNDQIIEVLGSDGTTWSLRGNVHDGETLVSQTREYQIAGESWKTWNGSGKGFLPAHRYRWTWNTKYTRPAPDSDDFATSNHVTTWFPDGVARTDRTFTLTSSQTFRAWIEWMSSFALDTPYLGRIGRGLKVLDEVDSFPKLTVPGSVTSSNSTSGGSLAAATYAYVVTAVTEGGETTASASTAQTTTGTTSRVTVNWGAVSGALGYRIYGRTANRLGLIANVAGSATSWIDDGTLPVQPAQPPRLNTARNLASTSPIKDCAAHGNAWWSVWYDPINQVCYGNVFDRPSVTARSEVGDATVRLLYGDGTNKHYLTLSWANGTDRVTLASGTSWSATHWHFIYAPQSVDNYHLEIALASLDLTALQNAYPAS